MTHGLMSTRTLKGIIVRVKSIFSKKPIQPKEPRKKIQLQIKIIEKEFLNQLKDLETRLEGPGLSDSEKKLGRVLMQNAMRFNELQISNINSNRLQTLPHSLIDLNDFSLYVKHELINLTEEIFHFLSTLENS